MCICILCSGVVCLRLKGSLVTKIIFVFFCSISTDLLVLFQCLRCRFPTCRVGVVLHASSVV